VIVAVTLSGILVFCWAAVVVVFDLPFYTITMPVSPEKLAGLAQRMVTTSEQASATIELCVLTSDESNRAAIAHFPGMLQCIVSRAESGFSRTREHAVEALMNLAVSEDNKFMIANLPEALSVLLNVAKIEVLEVLEGVQTRTKRKAIKTLASLAMNTNNQVSLWLNFSHTLLEKN
jgi:hypothetical protein